MPDPVLYLKAMASAAIASAVCVLAMAWFFRPGNQSWHRAGSVLSVVCGMAAGCHVLTIHIALPPVSGLDRLLSVILPAIALIELISCCDRFPNWLAWTLRLTVAIATPRILLHGSIYLNADDDTWSRADTVVIPACSALLLSAVWVLHGKLSHRTSANLSLVALSLTIPVAGATVMMAGYLKGGEVTFPLTAALLTTTLTSWLLTRPVDSDGRPAGLAIAGIGVVGLCGVLFVGRFFGRLPTGYALILLSAPLLSWTSQWPRLKRCRPWVVTVVCLLIVAIPLAIVLWMAKRDFDRDMAPLLGRTSKSPQTASTG